MSEGRTGTTQPRKGRRVAVVAAGIVIVGVVAGLAYFEAPASHDVTPVVTTTVQDASPGDAVDTAPRHMTRAGGYHMYVAYFEEHQVGDAMNQDALAAIRLAADDAKKGGQSLVVTCHGDDAIPGNPKATERDFKLARFVTIRDDLIAQGLEADRIKNEWSDPALRAAAAKEGPKSSAERPNCYIETAVPTSLD